MPHAVPRRREELRAEELRGEGEEEGGLDASEEGYDKRRR